LGAATRSGRNGKEVGDAVVFSTTGGSLDLSAWTNANANLDNASIAGGQGAGPWVHFGGGTNDIYHLPDNFVSAGVFFSSGDIYPFDFTTGGQLGIGSDSFMGLPGLTVPEGYVSGTSVGPTSGTILNASISSLQLTPGSYTWSWGYQEMPGTGPTIVPLDVDELPAYDFIRLDIKPPSVPDGGTTALLGLLASGGLGFLRRFMK
jgi:hypothetical protein